MADLRHQIAAALVDVTNRWITPNFPEGHKLRTLEELDEQEQRLNLDYADAAIKMLHAEVRGGAWQPIETAPADTPVLVCGGVDQGSYYVADAKLIDGIWYLFDLEIDGYAWASDNHTHWMPLPLPPQTEGEA